MACLYAQFRYYVWPSCLHCRLADSWWRVSPLHCLLSCSYGCFTPVLWLSLSLGFWLCIFIFFLTLLFFFTFIKYFIFLKVSNMPFQLECSSRSERARCQWRSLCIWTFECLQPINNQGSQGPAIPLCINCKRRLHIWWESKKCTGCWIQSCNCVWQWK